MEFIIASHNQKKIREMDAILGALGISFSPLPEGAPEPEETGTTFEENALIKAQAACQLTGKPAIADDSGLAVEALDGAPGIYSARYCEGSDADRNAFLLRKMEAVPDGSRQAKFVSAIACAFPNGDTLTVRGECPGEILRELHGEGGFGYDPVFFLPQLRKTYAQLTPEEKAAVSHRGKALEVFDGKLRTYLAGAGK